MPGSPVSRPVTTTGAPKPPAPRAAGAIIRATASASVDRRLFMEGWLASGGGADYHVQIASIRESGGGQGDDRVTSLGSGPWPRARTRRRPARRRGVVIQLGTR